MKRFMIPLLAGSMIGSPAPAAPQGLAGTLPNGSSAQSNPPTQALADRALDDAVEETLLLFDFERHDRMTLPVTLGDRGGLDFMVDTGAERSAVSLEVANELGLSPAKERTVVSFAGFKTVPTVTAPSLGLTPTDFHSMEMLTFARRAIGADGVLGIDSLHDKVVTFDFAHQEMRIRKADHGRVSPGSREVAVDLEDHDGRMVIANATIDGVPLDMIIDTGSPISVGNLVLRDTLAQKGRIEKLQEGVMLTFTGQLVPVELGIVRNVDVDGFTITRMPVAFVESMSFDYLGYSDEPVLYFGMEAMRAFEQLEVDFANRRALFKARDVPGFDSRGTWWVEQEQKRNMERRSQAPVRPTQRD